MSKSRRRDIKKAQQRGLQFHTSLDVRDYYALYRKTVARLHLTQEPESFFQMIWQQLVATGIAKVFAVTYNGTVIASSIVITDPRGVLYWWRATSDRQYWRLHPNPFMLWSIAEWGKENGYNTLDLFHYYSSVPGSEFYNLFTFKRQFGETVYLHRYRKYLSRFRYLVYQRLLACIKRADLNGII